MWSLLRKNKWQFISGLILFFSVYVLYAALGNDSQKTQVRHQPFPAMKIASLDNHAPRSIKELANKPTIVHIWASWCGVCLEEHQAWLNIKEKWNYPMIGVVFRDDRKEVLNFLAKRGSPYNWILNDAQGKLGIALGLVGTPQTYIVDAQGVIQFQYIGAIDETTFKNEFVPVLKRLEKT